MAKLVDAPDLGSGVSRRVGSSPIRRTIGQNRRIRKDSPIFLIIDNLSPLLAIITIFYIFVVGWLGNGKDV